MSRAINWKWEKIQTILCEKANFWTFEVLTDFFWNFYGKYEIVKINNVHHEVTVFCGQFC